MPKYRINYSAVENYEIEVNAKNEQDALDKFNIELSENGFDNFTYIDGDTAYLKAELIKNSKSVEL
jgi:hypothetical protein